MSTINLSEEPRVMIEKGAIATDYIAPNYRTIPIAFPSEAGTVYGGYVDLINGEIVQEWEIVTTRWGDIKRSYVNSTTGFYEGKITFSNKIVVLHNASNYGVNTISNVFNTVSWNGGGTKPEHYYGGNDNDIGVAYLYANYSDDTVIQIAARLAEPIHYPIDPQTLKSLRGTNNIWSNANGNIELSYWKH